MFPAFSNNKNAPTTSSSSLFTQDNDHLIVAIRNDGHENLTNQTFKSLQSLKLAKQQSEEIIELSDENMQNSSSDQSESDGKFAKKRNKKEKKKKKKKKREKSPISPECSPTSSAPYPSYKSKKFKPLFISPEAKLIDLEYQTFFAKFTKDQLKSFQFQEDFIAHGGILPRNSFKLDKRGDRNNLCFDQVYYKQLSNYSIPFYFDRKQEDLITNVKQSKTTKKMTRKQLRRKILIESRQKRYYSQKIVETSLSSTSHPSSKTQANDTLSNKMWLYLEMKKQFDQEMTEAPPPTDYVKYLHENKHDIDKWLEFVDSQQQNTYERILSIYEKAIQENPTSFRLKIEFVKFKAKSVELNTSEFDVGAKIEKDYFDLLFLEAAFLGKKIEPYMNLFETWFEYLRFLQESNLSQHTFEKIKRAYAKCFDFFLTRSHKDIIKKPFFIDNYLRLLDSYCSFLTLNGYFEKSLAVYQAVIDFNFCSQTQDPKSQYNNLDFKSRKALYELFFDMGLPKFGEKFYIGWLNSLENRQSQFDKLDNQLDEETRYEERLDHIEDCLLVKDVLRVEYKWSEIERLRARFFWYPFYPRTFSGESADDCCDPDRLISFDDDLRFCLFDLTNEEEDYYKFQLFCKLLKIFNLIKWNDATEISFLNGDKEFASCLGMGEISEDFLSDLFKNLSKNVKSFYGEEEKIYLMDMFKSLTKNFIDFIRNCFRIALESGAFKSLESQTNIIILKWRFELKIFGLLKKYPLTFEKGNIIFF